jgi:6-phosphogluconolactonase
MTMRLAQLPSLLCHTVIRSVGLIALLPLFSPLASCGGGGGASPPPITYTLAGRVQKGPFTVGSSISVNELNASLSPTGKVYNVQTSDALGNFAVSSQIGTPQVEIVAQGFYIDELTGQLSASQITLRAVADLSVNSSPTVNVLTTLQEQRLKTLMSQGSSFAAANTQSQNEVLALFSIDSTKVTSLTTLVAMRIDGSTDADAVLLATSVILSQMATDVAKANGTTQAAELSNLVNTLSAQLANSGTVPSATFTAARNLAETEISAATVTSNLQTYYANNGLTVVAPKFVEWVDQSNSGILPQRLVPVTGLTFTDVSAATPGQLVTSNAVTIAGAGAGIVAPITATAGTTIIKNAMAVVGRYSTAKDGDSIAAQITAPGYSLTNTSMISIGSTSAAWNVTSEHLGGTIAGLTGTGLVLQNNGGDNVTIQSGSTTLSFPSAMANGTTYNVTVLTQPNSPLQSCDVTNGSGTVGATQSSIRVVCTSASLVFVANAGSNTITVYTLSPTTGAMTPVVGSPFADAGEPYSLTVDPTGKFLYVANNTGNSVSAFGIDTNTGGLAQLTGSPYSADTWPEFVTFDPTGKFLYVPNVKSNDISAYTMNSTTGALTSITGSPFAAGASPDSVAIDPTGQFAYAGNGDGTVSAYTINAIAGSLSTITGSPFAAGTFSYFVTVDPSGRFAYVANTGDGTVSAFAISATTGALTPIAGSPFPAGSAPRSITVDPTGRYVYVIATGSSNVSALAINSTTGALASVVGSPFSTNGQGAYSLSVDPTGKFAFVANANSNNISVLAINLTNGALTPVPGSPFAAGSSPYSIAIR